MHIDRATFERSFFHIGPGFDSRPRWLIDRLLPRHSRGSFGPCLADLLEMKEICLKIGGGGNSRSFA